MRSETGFFHREPGKPEVILGGGEKTPRGGFRIPKRDPRRVNFGVRLFIYT